jgi:hypothetical protein
MKRTTFVVCTKQRGRARGGEIVPKKVSPDRYQNQAVLAALTLPRTGSRFRLDPRARP